MCETLSLARQEHHGSSRIVFGGLVGPLGRAALSLDQAGTEFKSCGKCLCWGSWPEDQADWVMNSVVM